MPVDWTTPAQKLGPEGGLLQQLHDPRGSRQAGWQVRHRLLRLANRGSLEANTVPLCIICQVLDPVTQTKSVVGIAPGSMCRHAGPRDRMGFAIANLQHQVNPVVGLESRLSLEPRVEGQLDVPSVDDGRGDVERAELG